jgi:hypothetical protein
MNDCAGIRGVNSCAHIGGVFEVDGERRRLSGWRRSPSNQGRPRLRHWFGVNGQRSMAQLMCPQSPQPHWC